MLYFDEAFKEDKVWVRNVHKPRGILVIVLADKNGRQHKLTIPDTPHPICLSQLATKDMLQDSIDLRHYLSKGILEFVSTTQAEREWKDPHVKSAVAKAMSEATGRTHKVVDSVTTKVIKDDGHEDNFVVTKSSSGNKILREAAVDNKVVVLLEQLKTREIRARECIDSLEGIDIDEDSYKYIVAQSTGLVEKWAKNKLALLGKSVGKANKAKQSEPDDDHEDDSDEDE